MRAVDQAAPARQPQPAAGHPAGELHQPDQPRLHPDRVPGGACRAPARGTASAPGAASPAGPPGGAGRRPPRPGRRSAARAPSGTPSSRLAITSGRSASVGVQPPITTSRTRGTGTLHPQRRAPARLVPGAQVPGVQRVHALGVGDPQHGVQLGDRQRRGGPDRRVVEPEALQQRPPVPVGQVDGAVPVQPEQVGHLEVDRDRADVLGAGVEPGAAPLEQPGPRCVLLTAGDQGAVEHHPAAAASGAPAAARAPGRPRSSRRCSR